MPHAAKPRHGHSVALRVILTVALIASAACEQKPSAAQSASPTPSKSPAAPAPAVNAPAPAPLAAPVSSGEVDHFPSGQSTPEGVACDLVRSYITSNSDLFKACCFVITPGSPERDAYNNFLDETATKMDVGKSSSKSEGDWPVSIAAVYKARALSSASAGAYGAENFRLISVMFVDIQTPIRHGNTETRRALVVQDEGSKLWTAVPRPELFPQLSAGLTDEPASTELWKPKMP